MCLYNFYFMKLGGFFGGLIYICNHECFTQTCIFGLGDVKLCIINIPIIRCIIQIYVIYYNLLEHFWEVYWVFYYSCGFVGMLHGTEFHPSMLCEMKPTLGGIHRRTGTQKICELRDTAYQQLKYEQPPPSVAWERCRSLTYSKGSSQRRWRAENNTWRNQAWTFPNFDENCKL